MNAESYIDQSEEIVLKSPSEEVLKEQLNLQWQDHIQTREQTWKTVQIEIAVLAAIIAADFKTENVVLLLVLSLVMSISSLFGFLVTVHHRKIQLQKFKYIHLLEEKLGLHNEGYMDDLKKNVTADFSLNHFLFSKTTSTPAFIAWMHILMFCFIWIYVSFRLFTN